jgi:glycogen debranching enzyme
MEPATNLEHVTVIEHANFAVSDSRGDMLPGGYHGFFASDTRYLSRFSLHLGGKRLEALSSGTPEHEHATFYLTNPLLGGLERNSLVVFRDRQIDDVLTERIRIISYRPLPVRLRLTLALDADFADLFEVRGWRPLRRLVRKGSSPNGVRFTYVHRGYVRTTTAEADREVDSVGDGRLRFDLRLTLGVPWDLTVTVRPGHTISRPQVRPLTPRRIDTRYIERWRSAVPRLSTLDRRLSGAWSRAVRDMHALLLAEPGGGFIPAAGMPWFMAIFGRDSAIASMQAMVTGTDIAFGTLRELASYQGRELNHFREEEPGKIPHEVRSGELATLGRVPFERYYGSVDATPLFVLLFVEACRWSGWLPPVNERGGPVPARGRSRRSIAESMPRELKNVLPAVERALRWIDDAGLGRDGLVWYRRRHRSGIRNQAWKDSHDSYRFADGRLADPPIAAVEVQGYVVAAWRGIAQVWDALDLRSEADRLRRAADELAARIEAAFWMPDEGYYAMGLDHRSRPIDAITSNPGHLLWCGIPDPSRATAVADRLLSPELFSGWGVRTMSNRMPAYNPISYHNGSVWPHDNSLIAAGLARYGYVAKAWKLLDAQLDACIQDRNLRLPELFAGFDRSATPDLVPYPAACAPQAWATGAIFLAVTTALGLAPAGEGPPRTSPLPAAPPLEVSGMRVGSWLGDVDNRPSGATGMPATATGVTGGEA